MAEDSGAFSALESLLGDRYTREARLAPALLCLFPIFLVLIASLSGLHQATPALLAVLCVFGVARWVSHIARSIGDRKESELFRRWGGKPTTVLLRYAAGRIEQEKIPGQSQVAHLLYEAPTLESLEDAIRAHTALQLPTSEEDKDASKSKDPIAALDRIYEPVVAWLRENTRDKKLVFEENLSYGFQRNFYALRRFALFCGLLALAMEIAIVSYIGRGLHIGWGLLFAAPGHAIVLAALIAYILAVYFFVSENSVRIQGFTYARQLLNSIYGPQQPAQKPGGMQGSGHLPSPSGNGAMSPPTPEADESLVK